MATTGGATGGGGTGGAASSSLSSRSISKDAAGLEGAAVARALRAARFASRSWSIAKSHRRSPSSRGGGASTAKDAGFMCTSGGGNWPRSAAYSAALARSRARLLLPAPRFQRELLRRHGFVRFALLGVLRHEHALAAATGLRLTTCFLTSAEPLPALRAACLAFCFCFLAIARFFRSDILRFNSSAVRVSSPLQLSQTCTPNSA